MDYKKKTNDIEISVSPSFLDSQSDPDNHEFLWAYKIIIRNESGQTVQLKTRYWKIIDAYGNYEEVAGDGVIGEQPRLEPGHSFEYSSGAPLRTPTGFMTGRYTMENENGERFDVEIPTFSLDSPYHFKRVN